MPRGLQILQYSGHFRDIIECRTRADCCCSSLMPVNGAAIKLVVTVHVAVHLEG